VRGCAVLAGLVVIVFCVQCTSRYSAEFSGCNTVTCINHSGEDALVKLVCPGGAEEAVAVKDGSKSSIGNLSPGSYFIKIRYGQESSCHYAKGDPLSITASYPQYARVSITLHPVAHRNYSTYPLSASDF
jgi:hypothetical protein